MYGNQFPTATTQSVQSKLESARQLLSAISSQRARWDSNLKVIRDRIDSVPGHALLCSASMCYLARTPPDTHGSLLTNWLGYCSGEVGLGSLAAQHEGVQAAQVILLMQNSVSFIPITVLRMGPGN